MVRPDDAQSRRLSLDRGPALQSVSRAEPGYHLSSKARVVLEAFNLYGAEVSDIDYFYTSRLRGEPAGGVDDVHRHPTLPRTMRLVLRVQF